jgi:hypothetical protein
VSVLIYGDVGGFDVSGAARVTWQALATLNYAFNDRWSISGGYKALAVDYSSDDYVYDTVLSGPQLVHPSDSACVAERSRVRAACREDVHD